MPHFLVEQMLEEISSIKEYDINGRKEYTLRDTVLRLLKEQFEEEEQELIKFSEVYFCSTAIKNSVAVILYQEYSLEKFLKSAAFLAKVLAFINDVVNKTGTNLKYEEKNSQWEEEIIIHSGQGRRAILSVFFVEQENCTTQNFSFDMTENQKLIGKGKIQIYRHG